MVGLGRRHGGSDRAAGRGSPAQAKWSHIPCGATLLPGESYASTGSFVDPGADDWTATVDYGDGAGTAALALGGRSFTLAHRYVRAGTFTVQVVVHDGRDAGTATAQVVVQTPAQGVGTLSAAVAALAERGALGAGNTTSLTEKLDAAVQQLARGNASAAAAPLGAFVHEVEALVRAGRLTATDGATLTALAERIARSMATE